MGNPQKSRPITGVEKSKESAGVKKSAPSEHIGDHLEDTEVISRPLHVMQQVMSMK
jgi:hypothetical protein